jgi:hypothetical protein
MKRFKFTLSLALIAILSVMYAWMPNVKALSVLDVVVSFTPPYGTACYVQTDANGNIYYGNDLGNVYKSTDEEHMICTK